MHLNDLMFMPLFQDLEPREISALEAVLSEKHLAPGEKLFDQGDGAWACYIVIEGSVDVALPVEGSLQVVANLGPGQILGEICLIDGGRRSARCVAGVDGARLAQLARPEFDRIFNAGNRLAFRLVDLISDQLVERLRHSTALLQEEAKRTR